MTLFSYIPINATSFKGLLILQLIFLWMGLKPVMAQAATPTNDTQTVDIGDYKQHNQMVVWPTGGLPKRPLLIVAHGNGGSGQQEIRSWLTLAKKHQFTVVCPTFVSSWDMASLPDDKPYFQACIDWIERDLQYDKNAVFMTGFSGGGCPVWYFATNYPHFFNALLLQSANFHGENPYMNLSGWQEKPIRITWGSNDLPNIIQQNKDVLTILTKYQCKDVSYKIVKNSAHTPQRELVIRWMKELLANDYSGF